jgi:hypothetical protein
VNDDRDPDSPDTTGERGDDSPSTRRDPPPSKEPIFKSDPTRRGRIKESIEGPARELPRQLGLWPYLLVRAYPGDAGLRPPSQGVFWESPDILVFQGAVNTADGHTPVINPIPGRDHTLFVRVWNLGRLPALGVSVRVWWANPSFDPNDPAAGEQPHYIGGAYATIQDRYHPKECHPLIRVSPTWRPVTENQGHECLLAKVESIVDPAGPRFHTYSDRHVGQRNIMLASASTDLSPILMAIGRTLPLNADLELLHGMADLHPVLLAHQADLVRELTPPRTMPAGAARLPDGSGHLGAIVRTPAGPRYVPGPAVAPGLSTERTGAVVANHVDARPIDARLIATHAIVTQLGVPDLRAATIAARLGTTNEAHVLRFRASKNGQPIGGYTVIVQG